MRPLPPLGLSPALLLTAALLVAWPAAGCGGDPDGAPANDRAAHRPAPVEPAPRLGWTLTEGAPPPSARRLESFELGPGATLAGWTVDAPRVNRQRLPAGGRPGAGAVVLLLRAPRLGQPMHLLRAAPLPDAAGLLTLEAAFDGAATARVELLRDGEPVAASAAQPLEGSEDVASRLLRLPAERPPHDAVRLVVEGPVRRLGVQALHWQTRVPGEGLPPLSAPELTARGERRLRAGVLHADARAALDAPLPAHVELRLHAALPEGAAPVALELRTRPVDAAPDAPWTTETWSVDRADAWQARALAPAPVARAVQLAVPADAGPVLLAAPRVPVAPPAEGLAPLVLLITSGSHRGDHLGAAFRGVEIPTPRLDALAAEGLLFADAFTVTNHAVPALAALHTGLPPRDTGLLAAGQRLDPRATTLAEVLADAGWSAAAVLGGSHLAPARSGLGQGFELVEAPARSGLWSAEVVVERARALLAEWSGEPLFLWVALTDGRWPHEARDETVARLYDLRDRARVDKLRPGGRIRASLPEAYRDERDPNWLHAHYKASLVELDAALAPLLDLPRVTAAPRAFVGDHGLGLGEHHVWYKPMGLYPGVLRVPLIVAAPGLAAGQRREDPVSSVDLGRTLLDLAGLEQRAFPGRSLLTPRDPDTPRFAVESDGLSASISTADRHLVLHLRDRRINHLVERARAFAHELYDLRADPGAERPLSTWDPEDGEGPVPPADDGEPAPAVTPEPAVLAERERLRDALTAWLLAQPAADLAAPGALDPLIHEERLALGYMGAWPTLAPRLLDREGCPWCDS